MSTNTLNKKLWNEEVTKETYNSHEQYQEHIFEQYKILVESAEKVSDRRNVAKTFFLSLNSLIITIVAFLYEGKLQLANKWFVLFPLVAILSLCYVWWRLIHSYKQLNTAKFKVIDEYEKRLPSMPYVSAEWKALGEGKEPKLYKPLTDVESRIPAVFACLYFIGALAIIFL